MKKYVEPKYSVIELHTDDALLLNLSNGKVGGGSAKTQKRLWADDEEEDF